MPWAAGTKKYKKVFFFPGVTLRIYRVIAGLYVYEKLDQLDKIKVKCRDFPLGKALPFLSQTWTKGEVTWEKSGHLKRALIYAMNEKKIKTGSYTTRVYGKTSSGTIKSIGLGL